MLKISDDRIRFSDAYVRRLSLPAGKSDHIAWDPGLPGFGVRLRSGKASYVVQYRVGIEQRRKSLGDVRKVSVDDARGIARKRFAQVELGVDPDAEEESRRVEQAAHGRTFEKIVELYLEAQKPRVRPNTYIAEERYLRRHCDPLRKKPVSKVTHNANVIAAEGARQTAQGVAKAAYNGTPAAWPAYDAAIKAADISYHRALIASAAANGMQGPRGSLRDLTGSHQ